jgi:hypothetical protein
MNLTPYNDNLRLNGYYPKVTREGELIEHSLEYQERQDRREKHFSYLLLVTLICVMIFTVYLIESRREFLLATYIIDYQERKEKIEAEQKKEVFNFRKFIGVGK